MSTITTRSGKGSPLTHTEGDANFTNLNTDKLENINSENLGDLSNVSSSAPSDGQVLTYVTASSEWQPQTAAGGGGGGANTGTEATERGGSGNGKGNTLQSSGEGPQGRVRKGGSSSSSSAALSKLARELLRSVLPRLTGIVALALARAVLSNHLSRLQGYLFRAAFLRQVPPFC